MNKKENVISFKAQPGKQKMALDQKVDVMIYGGAAGCLSKDHEVLTPEGWIKISSWSGQSILEYDQSTGTANFREPLEYHKIPCNKLTRIKGNGIRQELSDEHRIIFKPDYNKKPKVISFEEMKSRHNKSKTKGWTGKFMTTFNYSGDGLDMSEGELRLQVAVMADGRIVKEGRDNYTQMRFSKKSKYDRLIELCEKFNLPYRDNGAKCNEKYKSGFEYEVIVWPKTSDKIFTKEFYQCSKEQLAYILDECFYWDGTIVQGVNSRTGRYFTKYKSNADFIQFAGSACGYNTTITHDNRESKETFTVNVMTRGKGLRSLANKDQKAVFEEFIPEDGFKYCFTTSTGFFVTRLDDCVVVTGNSGKSRLILLKALKYAAEDPDFEGVLFRRTSPPLKAAGGLFTEAKKLYSPLKPRIREKDMEIIFDGREKKGGSLKFTHLENENDAEGNHQGLQYSMVAFDEL